MNLGWDKAEKAHVNKSTTSAVFRGIYLSFLINKDKINNYSSLKVKKIAKKQALL